MKTIRNLMTLAGLAVVIFALSATGAKAQQAPSLTATNLSGTFTLPVAAQWGRVTLPAGKYSLYYGTLHDGTSEMVEVVGKANGPRGIIPTQSPNDASTAKSALICVRQGGALIVRKLEMPSIGLSVEFALPRGTQLTAQNGKHKGYTQLAAAPMLLQRIPVTLNAK